MIFGKWIDKRIDAYQSDLMKKYCDEVESMYTKMRGWRHDYHNHIQAMQASMALGRYQEVSDYLRELNDDLVNVDTVLKTGRVMVDAILNGKISIAAGNDIPVNAKAKLPPNLDMNDVDLCVVIGNLMDNAIEGCMELPPEERLIRIYMEMKGTYLYLVLTNTAGGKKKHSFRTSKGEGHGFGIARIDSIVKKCGGYVTRASEDGAFSTEILLPQAVMP